MFYMAFAFFLQKGTVFRPDTIQAQFLFTSASMLQMFLAAVLASQISMMILALVPGVRQKWFGAAEQSLHDRHSTRSRRGVALGSALLGAGMAIAGTCPGTIYAQLGAGIHSALYVLAGGLAGALLYSLLSPYMPVTDKQRRAGSLYRHLDAHYTEIAPVSALMIAVILAVLVWMVPSGISLPTLDRLLSTQKWPPYFAGFAVGALQIPSIIFLGVPLGASTNMVALLAPLNWVPGLVPPGSEVAKFQPGSMATTSKIIAVVGAISGGYLAALSSHSVGKYPDLSQSSILVGSVGSQAFYGGVLLLFGSRMAGGCTSGHGISGFGLLLFNSLIAVPTMFASAIITANIMKQLVS
jgi:uncharacterized membrane protein YedE/YeeE